MLQNSHRCQLQAALLLREATPSRREHRPFLAPVRTAAHLPRPCAAAAAMKPRWRWRRTCALEALAAVVEALRWGAAARVHSGRRADRRVCDGGPRRAPVLPLGASTAFRRRLPLPIMVAALAINAPAITALAAAGLAASGLVAACRRPWEFQGRGLISCVRAALPVETRFLGEIHELGNLGSIWERWLQDVFLAHFHAVATQKFLDEFFRRLTSEVRRRERFLEILRVIDLEMLHGHRRTFRVIHILLESVCEQE
mmetsp:Transcript_61094/g.170903  ORF Transcript_61094/g.170903 Transcript_61094/m.170903 type:complete len:256 (-) Transcript_61094:2120-2887(-)